MVIKTVRAIRRLCTKMLMWELKRQAAAIRQSNDNVETARKNLETYEQNQADFRTKCADKVAEAQALME